MLTDSLRDIAANHGWQICDEAADKIEQLEKDLLGHSDYELGKNDGWEACETCHGIVDGVSPHRRAIEVEVRMEAQEPVASANDAAKMCFFRDMTSTERRKVFEAFGIESAVLNEVRSLFDETRLFKHLFATPQPPAPCQHETDTEYYRAECEKLQVKVEQLQEESRKAQREIAGDIVTIRECDDLLKVSRAKVKQQKQWLTERDEYAESLRAEIALLESKVESLTTYVPDALKHATLQAKVDELTDESEYYRVNRDISGHAYLDMLRQRNELVTKVAELGSELEMERMRLAACGVVALANTPDSAKQARTMLPEYHSGSLDDIARIVDSEMSLRSTVAELTREVAQWKNNHATVVRQARVLKERTDMPLERVKAYEHYGEMIERVTEQSALIERLKQEAQVHAQEARTANATIAEIYQAISGATGEPGNWNGAKPVREFIAQQAALIEKCEKALSRADRKLSAYVEVCMGDKELTGSVLPMVAEALAAIAAQKGGAA